MGREPRYFGGPRHGEQADRPPGANRILHVPFRDDGYYVWVQRHARYEWRGKPARADGMTTGE